MPTLVTRSLYSDLIQQGQSTRPYHEALRILSRRQRKLTHDGHPIYVEKFDPKNPVFKDLQKLLLNGSQKTRVDYVVGKQRTGHSHIGIFTPLENQQGLMQYRDFEGQNANYVSEAVWDFNKGVIVSREVDNAPEAPLSQQAVKLFGKTAKNAIYHLGDPEYKTAFRFQQQPSNAALLKPVSIQENRKFFSRLVRKIEAAYNTHFSV